MFSQFSSSLLSAQSSSPSQRQDRRTQRPERQRNCSAVHMEVAGRAQGSERLVPFQLQCALPPRTVLYASTHAILLDTSVTVGPWGVFMPISERYPSLSTRDCHLMENYHAEYINLYNYRTRLLCDWHPFGHGASAQCTTYTTGLGGPVHSVFMLCWWWPLWLHNPSPYFQLEPSCCPLLTAVALIRLVVTVCVAIAAPPCIDAQATVTHELPGTAGLVGGWENMTILSPVCPCTEYPMGTRKPQP